MMANLSIINKVLSFLIENSGVFRTLLITLYIILILTWTMKSVLRTDVDALTRWFIKTTLLLIPSKKYHFSSLGKDTANETFIFKNLVMNNSEEQKYLGLL